MSVTHGAATRTALADATVDRLDLGSGQAAGSFKIYAADDTLLCTIDMVNPAFGGASGPTATCLSVPLSGVAPTIAAGPKNATKFEAVNRDGVAVFLGSVGTSAADLILDNVSINTGQTVTITAATYTAPV
jgi:hypothetical protein